MAMPTRRWWPPCCTTANTPSTRSRTTYRGAGLKCGGQPGRRSPEPRGSERLPMPKLILVRHAAPATDACVAANQWPLSDAGRRSVHGLAEALAPFWPAVAVLSRPDWRLEQLIEKVEADGHQVG